MRTFSFETFSEVRFVTVWRGRKIGHCNLSRPTHSVVNLNGTVLKCVSDFVVPIGFVNGPLTNKQNGQSAKVNLANACIKMLRSAKTVGKKARLQSVSESA